MSVGFKYSILFIFIFLCLDIEAQGTFGRKYSLLGSSSFNGDLIMLPDSGYLMSTPFNAFSLTRVNKNGDAVWSKTMDSGNGAESCSIVLSPNENFFYVVYCTLNGGSVDYTVLLKYDMNGNKLWHKSYANTSMHLRAKKVHYHNNFLYLTGVMYDEINSPSIQFFAAKMDTSGNYIWANRYDVGVENIFGASIIASNGDLLLTGSSTSIANTMTSLSVFRINANTGALIWGNLYPQSNYYTHHSASIVEDPQGNIVIAGAITTVSSSLQPFLFKMNSGGNKMLSKKYVYDLGGGAHHIFPTSDNGYMLITQNKCTDFKYRLLLIKTNDQGSASWAKLYEADIGFQINSAERNEINGFTILGFNSNSASLGSSLLIKTDVNAESPCTFSTVSVLDADYSTTLSAGVTPSAIGGTIIQTLSVVSNTVSVMDFCPVIGIDEFETGHDNIIVYPSPAQSNVTIDISSSTGTAANISVMDMMGIGVKEFVIDYVCKPYKLNVEDLKDGIYTMRIECPEFIRIKRIIIKKEK